MGLFDKLFGSPEQPGEKPGISGIELEQEIKKFVRPSWKPVTLDGDGDAAASKFSGTPWLAENEEWPKCKHCNEPLQLFIQLNSSDLPEESNKPFGEGVLQLFYCVNQKTECEQYCDAWFPFAKSVLGRVVNAQGRAKQAAMQNAYPSKLISKWQQFDDFPNSEEIKSLGINFDWDDFEPFSDQYAPKPGDKLLGWPAWVQGLEYPICPQCNQRMIFIFQIDSEDNLPYMFGDVGCGHVTYCPCNRSVAFGWACG